MDGGEAAGEWVTVTVTKDGREVSREQIVFGQQVITQVETQSKLPENLILKDGTVCIERDGKQLCAAVPYTVLFRAPMDNDINFMMADTMAPYTAQTERVLETRIEENRITIVTAIRNKLQEFRCTDTYEACAQGVLVTSHLHCVRGGGDLPRFAKVFRLEDTFTQVEYLGRNDESYNDMKHHSQIAQVTCQVRDMTEPNLRPQESGNRCDCAWAKLSDGETVFTFTAVDKPFELGVKPYSDVELLTMKHREDEKVTGTYVAISALQMGVGTGICGPETRPEYRYSAKEDHVLRFIIG